MCELLYAAGASTSTRTFLSSSIRLDSSSQRARVCFRMCKPVFECVYVCLASGSDRARTRSVLVGFSSHSHDTYVGFCSLCTCVCVCVLFAFNSIYLPNAKRAAQRCGNRSAVCVIALGCCHKAYPNKRGSTTSCVTCAGLGLDDMHDYRLAAKLGDARICARCGGSQLRQRCKWVTHLHAHTPPPDPR